MVKRVTAAEQKLDVVQAHLLETEVALGKCLEVLEAERKAQANVE